MAEASEAETLRARVESLERELEASASANAHAAELMVALELTREELTVQVAALGRANAQSAELMASLETTSKELEVARDAALEASRAKSEFLANMSHEIRTPLNAIIALSELVLADDPTPEQRPRLEMVATAGDALLAIVNDVLDLAKIESGNLTVERAPVNVRDSLRDTVALVAAQAAEARVELRVEVDGAVPRVVMTDSYRLRQVLSNLLSNAIKFTPGGEVSVSVSVVANSKSTVELQWRVADTGIGIPGDRLDSILEPFAQVDASTTRKFGGTGLGLTIVRHIVTSLGGTIEISSVLGSGTTVEVLTPLEVSSVETPANEQGCGDTAATAASVQVPLRILLAEDNIVNQQVAIAVLGKLGHSVQVANHGGEALDILGTDSFDVVFMDMQMPQVDGVEATIELRKRFGKRDYIVAMTANALSHDRERCIAAGMNDFISKPVRMADLERALGQFLAARSTR